MRAVYATATTGVSMDYGRVVHIHFGDHWSADDPVVKAHPDLFSENPLYGMKHSSPEAQAQAEAPVVEVATAEPGEKRAVRRPA